MSDDDNDDSYREARRRDLDDTTLPNQNTEAVFRVLRDACDSLVLEFDSMTLGTFFVRRETGDGGDGDGGEDDGIQRKPCYLVATQYNVYLFKEKGNKLYYVWPLTRLKVAGAGSIMFLDKEPPKKPPGPLRGLSGAAGGSSALMNVLTGGGGGDEDEDGDGGHVPLTAEQERDILMSHFEIEAEVPSNITKCMTALKNLVFNAKKLEARATNINLLMGGGGGGDDAVDAAAAEGARGTRRVKLVVPGDDDETGEGPAGGEDNEEEAAQESSSSDEDDGDEEEDDEDAQQQAPSKVAQSGRDRVGATFAKRPLLGARKQQQTSTQPASASGTATRFNPLASLIEGEFSSDYSAVRNAYLQNKHNDLVAHMQELIADNERLIAKLCSEHYQSFLLAAERCNKIDAGDSLAVRDEINGACKHIKVSVHDMKAAATALLQTVSTNANITKGREALSAALVCAERLEEAEMLVSQRRLLAGVRALRRLESAAQLVVDTSLGTYVLADRIPRLRMAIMDGAMAQVNDWLMTIRRGSAKLGAIAMSLYTQQQRLTDAAARRVVVYGPEDDDWHIEALARGGKLQQQQQAALTAALQKESDLLVYIASGASVQQVFEECGQGAVFLEYYLASRKRQFEVDVVQRTGGATAARDDDADNGDSNESTPNEHDVFSIALGFILVEDTVNSVTNPAAHSDSQLLTLWQMVSAALVDHVAHLEQQVFLNIRRDLATAAGAAAPSASVDPYEHAVMKLIAKLQHFITVVHTQLRGSVEFDFSGIATILETLVNRLHSKWTQDCCGVVAGLIAVDQMTPLRCTSSAEYDEFVTRFELQRMKALCLPTFRAEPIYLPFSSSLPPIGRAVTEFFGKCIAIVPDCHSFSLVAKHNNIAAMLLEYLVVVFRTVTGTINGKLMGISSRSLFQYAVCASHAMALRGLCSLLEQRYMIYWGGAYDVVTQKFGSPLLLADSDVQLRNVHSRAVESCSVSLMKHIDELLLPLATLDYWEKRAQGSAECGVTEMVTYVMATVPKLSVAFGDSMMGSILMSIIMHVAEVLERHLIDAVHNMKLKSVAPMRVAVKKWLEVQTVVESWMQQIAAAASAPTASSATTSSSSNATAPAMKLMSTFPLNFKQVAAEQMKWIDAREVELAAIAAEELRVLALAEEAGTAIYKGAKTVTNATVNGVKTVSNATVSGVKTVTTATAQGVTDAAKTTKRTFFNFGRSVKETVTGGGGKGDASAPAAAAAGGGGGGGGGPSSRVPTPRSQTPDPDSAFASGHSP